VTIVALVPIKILGQMGPQINLSWTNGSRTNRFQTNGSRKNGLQTNGSQDKWFLGKWVNRLTGCVATLFSSDIARESTDFSLCWWQLLTTKGSKI